MIRINLLGDETVIDHSKKFTLAGFVTSVVATVIVSFMISSSVGSDVQDYSMQVKGLEGELNTLSEKTKAVKELESKRDTLNSKLAIIAKLRKSKIGPVRVMDDLNISVPTRVWLRALEEKGNVARIKGRAIANEDIAQFMRALENSDYFDAVDLVESRQMYYSKRTGKVTPQPDIDDLRKQSPDFEAESRSTKDNAVIREGMMQGKRMQKRDLEFGRGKSWDVKRNSYQQQARDRNRFIDDHLVKIKEFIVSANVNYAGKIVADQPVDEAKGKVAMAGSAEKR